MTADVVQLLKRLAAAVERLERPVERVLLDREGVLAKLNVGVDWWEHNYKRLRDAHGFPGPAPGFAHRWDPRAIDAWLDAALAPTERVELAGATGPEIDELRRTRAARILERAGARH